ncbi:MAG TPA: hypothetical protein VLH39_02210, partial [Magnetospirillaceae bacterium]|nr:hypothetical protein [Magnetospirillaceae bacterium]
AVLAGLNLRAELAANLTRDMEGGDPYVRNPHLVFSLGADRDLWQGINLNLQFAGDLRLGDLPSPFDIEAGTDTLRSTLTAVAFRRLFRDRFEARLSALWGFQDADYLMVPSISWTEGDAKVALSAGIFGGDAGGRMGQYRDADWVKLTFSYTF